MKLVTIVKPLMAIMLIVVTPIATWVKQSVTLVVNINHDSHYVSTSCRPSSNSGRQSYSRKGYG